MSAGTRATDDLLIDAAKDAIASAGVALDDIDAFWLGTMGSGNSGLTLSRPLKLDYRPVTRVGELLCHRVRGVPQRLLRRGLRRLRPGHGHRGREAEGLGLLGPHRYPPGRATAPADR